MSLDLRIPVIEWSPESGRPMPGLYRVQQRIWGQVPEDLVAKVRELGLDAGLDVRTWAHRGSVPALARRLVALRDGLDSAREASPTDSELDAVWSVLDALRQAGYLATRAAKRGDAGVLFEPTPKVLAENMRAMNEDTIANARRAKIPFVIRRWPALDEPCPAHGIPAESARSNSAAWESIEMGCACIFALDFGVDDDADRPSPVVSMRRSRGLDEAEVPVRHFAG